MQESVPGWRIVKNIKVFWSHVKYFGILQRIRNVES